MVGALPPFAAYPNTEPEPAGCSDTQIEFVYTQAARAGLCNVLPLGAITNYYAKGQELAEIAYLMHEAGAIGFSDDGIGVASAAVMAKALQYIKMYDGILSQHCEEPTLASTAP